MPGVLRQVKEIGHIRFRCHTGHAYSPESLLAEIRESIEVALWEAIRAMQEGRLLVGQLAEHIEAAHPRAHSGDVRHQEEELERKTDVLREMVTSTPDVPAATP